MLGIILAIVATLGAVIYSWIVLMANVMSSASGPFKGGTSMVVAWVAVALLWAAWYWDWY